MTLPIPAAPRTPRRCKGCGRRVDVGPYIDGYGPDCARQAGLLTPAPRIPKPRPVDHQGPDLLDELAADAPE